MKQLHKQKQHIIMYCTKVMRDEELLAEKKSIDLIRKFQSKKKHKLRDLDEQEDKALIIEEYETELMNSVEELEDDLMEIEMLLQEALHTSVGAFKEKVTAINGEMRQKTIDYVKFVTEQSETFSEKLRELAIKEQALFEEKIENEDPPEDDEEFDAQLNLLSDKESLI